MNNGQLTYQLQTPAGILTHGWKHTKLVRDGTDKSIDFDLDVEAQVRSGDYFVTLATTLDLINRHIANYYIRADLEDLVSDLIYLQDHYTITKRSE